PGPLTTVVFAILVLGIVYLLGIPSDASRRVQKVSPDTPAAKAGLRPGDEIVAVNLQPTLTFKQVSKAIRSSHGKPILVSINRRGNYVELPAEKTIKRNGYYIYGFSPAGIIYKHYNPAAARSAERFTSASPSSESPSYCCSSSSACRTTSGESAGARLNAWRANARSTWAGCRSAAARRSSSNR